jgi:hypothetical protein
MEGKATHVIISPVKAATGGGPVKEKSDKPEKSKDAHAVGAATPPAAHHS